jgi:hypothetical protein
MACHGCGLPENGKGRDLTITVKPENGFQRTRKTQVWVCSNECAWQTLAIARYGNAPSRWPVTLAQFRAANPLPTV